MTPEHRRAARIPGAMAIGAVVGASLLYGFLNFTGLMRPPAIPTPISPTPIVHNHYNITNTAPPQPGSSPFIHTRRPYVHCPDKEIEKIVELYREQEYSEARELVDRVFGYGSQGWWPGYTPNHPFQCFESLLDQVALAGEWGLTRGDIDSGAELADDTLTLIERISDLYPQAGILPADMHQFYGAHFLGIACDRARREMLQGDPHLGREIMVEVNDAYPDLGIYGPACR